MKHLFDLSILKGFYLKMMIDCNRFTSNRQIDLQRNCCVESDVKG